jgi:hypothetical protein
MAGFMKVRSQPEDIQREVVSKGFYFADDAVTGLRIEKLVQQQAPLTSANGLKFCHSNVVNHHVCPVTGHCPRAHRELMCLPGYPPVLYDLF